MTLKAVLPQLAQTCAEHDNYELSIAGIGVQTKKERCSVRIRTLQQRHQTTSILELSSRPPTLHLAAADYACLEEWWLLTSTSLLRVRFDEATTTKGELFQGSD